MADPTPTDYDKVQDGRLENVEAHVTGPAPDNSADEFSYPLVGQPMTDEMWGWVTRGVGNGILSYGGGAYTLTGRDNATDTATLQVSTLDGGQGHALVNGFYHHLSEPKTISLPAVSATTTYYICLTYDPVGLDQKGGPVTVQVYAGTPPTMLGKIHVILYTVTRKANQLLTDATVSRYRQRIAPLGYVWTRDQLPDVTKCLWGQAYIVGSDRDIVYTDGDDGSTPDRWTSLFTYVYTSSDDDATYKWPGHGSRRALAQTGKTVKLRGRVALTSGNTFKVGDDYNVMRINKARVRNWAQSFITDTSAGTARVLINASTTADPTNVSVTVTPHQTCSWVSLDGIQWDID
jgi:hypothetical protein